MTWCRIREGVMRYHAVYVTAYGLHWFYCGRTAAPASVVHQAELPPARCGACRSRIRCPFNIPEVLRKLRQAKSAGEELRPGAEHTFELAELRSLRAELRRQRQRGIVIDPRIYEAAKRAAGGLR